MSEAGLVDWSFTGVPPSCEQLSVSDGAEWPCVHSAEQAWNQEDQRPLWNSLNPIEDFTGIRRAARKVQESENLLDDDDCKQFDASYDPLGYIWCKYIYIVSLILLRLLAAGVDLLFDVFEGFSITDNDRQSTQVLQECILYMISVRILMGSVTNHVRSKAETLFMRALWRMD